MKIGIFDSGLGGLLITHRLMQALPEYDYLYLGDTARVPYGDRTQAAVYEFTRQAVDYLFKHGCALVVIACNTASAEALRTLQQEYMPKHHPTKKLLGVLIPAAEAAIATTKHGRIGVIATKSTVDSEAFKRELTKLNPEVKVSQTAAPLLVPLIEEGNLEMANPVLGKYLKNLSHIDTLILGCTHYPYMIDQVRRRMGNTVTIIAQDEILPGKLRSYLRAHPEVAQQLSHTGRHTFAVTYITNRATQLAARLYGQSIELELVSLKA